MPNSWCHVHSENDDRRTSHRALSHERWSIPGEMDIPIVTARIKERAYCRRQWINAGQIVELISIAKSASKSQVISDRRAAMFARRDVVNTKRNDVRICGEKAV